MSADTLPKLLLRNAETIGEQVALREKEFGIWQSLTWRQTSERVRNFCLGLIELGLGKDDKVAIIGDNRPEWLITELAAQAAGALSMGIYQDSAPEEVRYLVDFSDTTFVIAEDQEQVDKLLDVREQISAVNKIIYYDPRGLRNYDEPDLMAFEEVEELGRQTADPESRFRELVDATSAEDIAILSTTSGTTGTPKLAMLSHQNLILMAKHLTAIDRMEQSDEFVSFLPLAWIGEQMISVACGLYVGFTVNFPEEPETVQENIREIGPQMMFSPPRIWENMQSEVQVKIEDTTWLKRKIFDWAMGIGYQVADAKRDHVDLGTSLKIQAFLAEWCCFYWLRDKLGVRRIRRAYTGGAALGPDVFRFFHGIGVTLKQIYGQTEVSGVSVLHRDDDIKYQTVGKAVDETEVRIGEGGEILTKGPSVFLGYYKNPEATEETLKDGWMYSGDAGYFDDDGHLIVIDRAKDVMTLADGTQFSPQFIENKLKFSPYIRESVVFGGGDYPMVTCMITIDYANTGKWAERRQIPYTTFTDLSQKEDVYTLAREHVEATNSDLPEAARICKFVLLHKELDADDAELTRTRKVRRRFVAERYSEIIGGLYGEQDSLAIENEITYQDGRTATLMTNLRIESVKVDGD